MNSDEAKEILHLFRPDTGDESDPLLAEALAQTHRDPGLRRWFEQSCAFHAAMRQKLHEIPVPADLPEAILAGSTRVLRHGDATSPSAASKAEAPGPAVHALEDQTGPAGAKTVRLFWWEQPRWLATAAAILVLLGLEVFWLQPRIKDQFVDYRSRMVRTAVRQYRMDIATNDLKAVRQFLRKRGAPSNFTVTNGLEKLSVTGGVFSRWRGHPVAMVCFDRGDRQMLFLFVVDRSALKDPPPAVTQSAKVNKLLTASWTQEGRTYLLAGPEDSQLLKRSQ